MSRLRQVIGAAVAAAVVAVLAGCGLTIPTDPDGTLERAQGAVLRVGVTDEPGLIDVVDGRARGPLADLVVDFADSLDAEVAWTSASEESLVVDLEEGRLDLVVGGMTAETPWVDRVGVTRGYPGIPGSEDRQIVLFVPLGENAFLSRLETFLDDEVPT
jgi:ABC-type amino acid transport substrate-binding protein